jgi:hypothetical protein
VTGEVEVPATIRRPPRPLLTWWAPILTAPRRYGEFRFALDIRCLSMEPRGDGERLRPNLSHVDGCRCEQEERRG